MKNSFVQKNIHIKDIEMSYWDNGIDNYQKVIVLLPGGPDTGSIVKDYFFDLPANIRAISPDYPGRGNSEYIENNSPDLIADYVLELLKALKLKKITLAGLSFGGPIANELLKKDENIAEKLIVIASGEFFNNFQKACINILFIPARFSERIRKVYRSVIVKYFPVLNQLPKENLKSILYQWLTIVNYKINFTNTIAIPTLLISLTNDKVVKKGSILKLKAMYPNNKTIKIKGRHHPDFDKDKAKVISSLVKKMIQF